MWDRTTGLLRSGDRPIDAVVGTRDAPAEVISSTSLGSVDYLDLFTTPTSATATPEAWARAMFGDEPSLGERLIWRVLLGLRLADAWSPETVAGWTISGRTPEWIRLETRSRLLSANLVVHVGAETVGLATFLRYDRPAGRWLWTPASAVHRLLVPGVLRTAEKVVRRRALRATGGERATDAGGG